MEHPVKIRLAQVQDVKELLRLNKNQYMINQLEDFARWKIQNNNEIIAVAELKDKLIGFACAQVHVSFCHDEIRALINEVYVEACYRNQGIAISLIQLIESYLEKGNVKQIVIMCDSKSDGMSVLEKNHGYVVSEKIVFQKNN